MLLTCSAIILLQLLLQDFHTDMPSVVRETLANESSRDYAIIFCVNTFYGTYPIKIKSHSTRWPFDSQGGNYLYHPPKRNCMK